MITANHGMVEIKGKKNELYADLATIADALMVTFKEHGETKEDVEKFIHEAVANGLKDKEELFKEHKEEIRGVLTDIMESILKDLKGNGDK